MGCADYAIIRPENTKSIVVICGGTGGYTVLTGLKHYFDMWATAVVTMADDGGCAGDLRTHMGVLPPGDVRRALVALSEAEDLFLKWFAYRFDLEDSPPGSTVCTLSPCPKEQALKNRSLGNLNLAALEKITGSFEGAIAFMAHLLKIRGAVIPVTLNDVRLHVERADGSMQHGETCIDRDPSASARITKAWLDPTGVLNPRAREAILTADLVVIGPGDLYTSIVPNLLVKGMRETLAKSRAKKAFVVNVMTKRSETNGFLVHDYVQVARTYAGADGITHVLYNTVQPSPSALTRYHTTEGREFVSCDRVQLPGGLEYIADDLIATGDLVRHDSRKLAHALVSIIT